MRIDQITIRASIEEFVIFPRGGFVADGVRFVTTADNISGPVRPRVGSVVTKADVLHTWWCKLGMEEVRAMYADGITLDRVIDRFDVLQLG